MLANIEKLGKLVLRLTSLLVYSSREDSVISTRKIQGRQICLSDLLECMESNFFGADPKPKGEVWIAAEDFEYRWSAAFGGIGHTSVTFQRKITYAPEDVKFASVAFVSGNRRLKTFGTFRTRRVRTFWQPLISLAQLIVKKSP